MMAEKNVKSNSKLMKKVKVKSQIRQERFFTIRKGKPEEGVSFCYFFLVKQLLKQMQITLTK